MEWMQIHAYTFFLLRLEYWAGHYQLNYDHLKIRTLKSRWGSCRRDGQITLNSHLLFLPVSLVDHVILHELCHTRYLSHGSRFKALLSRLDANCAKHEKLLRQAGEHLPGWICA